MNDKKKGMEKTRDVVDDSYKNQRIAKYCPHALLVRSFYICLNELGLYLFCYWNILFVDIISFK